MLVITITKKNVLRNPFLLKPWGQPEPPLPLPGPEMGVPKAMGTLAPVAQWIRTQTSRDTASTQPAILSH